MAFSSGFSVHLCQARHHPRHCRRSTTSHQSPATSHGTMPREVQQAVELCSGTLMLASAGPIASRAPSAHCKTCTIALCRGGYTHPRPTGIPALALYLASGPAPALYLRLPLAGYFRPLSSPAHLFLSPSFHLQTLSIPWHFRQLVFHLSSPSPVRLLLLNQQGCSLFTLRL